MNDETFSASFTPNHLALININYTVEGYSHAGDIVAVKPSLTGSYIAAGYANGTVLVSIVVEVLNLLPNIPSDPRYA